MAQSPLTASHLFAVQDGLESYKALPVLSKMFSASCSQLKVKLLFRGWLCHSIVLGSRIAQSRVIVMQYPVDWSRALSLERIHPMRITHILSQSITSTL